MTPGMNMNMDMNMNKGPEIPFSYQHKKVAEIGKQEKVQVLCTEEFKGWPDSQIGIQLGALALLGDKEAILKALKKGFGFLEDVGPYLGIEIDKTGKNRPHIQLITPRGTLIDSIYGYLGEANQVPGFDKK